MKMGTATAHLLLMLAVQPLLLLLLAVLPLQLGLRLLVLLHLLLLPRPVTHSVPSSKVAGSRPGTSYTTWQARVKPMLSPRCSSA